jgi:hypothetical protein
MKRISCILLAVLFVGIVCYVWAACSEKMSTINQTIIKAKRQKIENEIAQLKNHPWAGEYYDGDGFGTNVTLTLAPKNGFTVTWFGCLGLYDQNHGKVDWDGDRIKMSFAFDLEDGYIGSYAAEYKPIRWGDRVYLVPADKIIKFCNAANSRDEPRKGVHGFFFLRKGDEEKEAEGKPELPEKFMPYLLDKPVNATVVSINGIQEDRGSKNATVVVDKGKNDGLLPGMKLHVVEPDMVFDGVEITKVEETQSEGTFVYGGPYDVLKTPEPASGWQLSTVPSWRFTAEETTAPRKEETMDSSTGR